MERHDPQPISIELLHKNMTADASKQRTNDQTEEPPSTTRQASQSTVREGLTTGVICSLQPLLVVQGKYTSHGPAATLLGFDITLNAPGSQLASAIFKLHFNGPGPAGVKVICVAPEGNYMRKVSSLTCKTKTNTETNTSLNVGAHLAERVNPLPSDNISIAGCVDDSEVTIEDTARWDLKAAPATLHTFELRAAALCKHSPRVSAHLTATLVVDVVADYLYNGEPVPRRFKNESTFRPCDYLTHDFDAAPAWVENMSSLVDEDDCLKFQTNLNALEVAN